MDLIIVTFLWGTTLFKNKNIIDTPTHPSALSTKIVRKTVSNHMTYLNFLRRSTIVYSNQRVN